VNNKLVFYNKEGYAYNFQYNNSTEYYEGKLFFDRNSSDTFKTIAFYIFEEVPPIDFIQELTLNKIEIFNESGMTFKSFTNSGNTITDIKKTNSVPTFYSKWIYGTNFDKLYPKGTIISFSGITISDFKNDYYTILDNKPGAILVKTNTTNDIYNSIYQSGGTIISHNIISINDYNNNLIPLVNDFTFHNNKKLNIIDSTYNTGLYSYSNSGITQTFYQTYDLSGASINDILKMNIELYTERPKIYQGEVTFDISGTTAILNFARPFNSFFNVEEGNSFICEDYNGNPIINGNPIFTVIDGAKDFDLFSGNLEFLKVLNENATIINQYNSNSTQKPIYDYYIQINGDGEVDYSIQNGDIIQLSATTNNNPKNDKRKFTVDRYISFREIRIEYWKNKIINDTSWMEKIKSNAVSTTLSYNKTFEEQIDIESIYTYNNIDNDQNKSTYIKQTDRYYKIKIVEYAIPEDYVNFYNIKKIVENSQTLICNISLPVYTGLTSNIIAYNSSNIISLEQTYISNSSNTIDYSLTIDAFNIKFEKLLSDYGIYVFYNDKLNIISRYNENYFNASVYTNYTYISGYTNNNFTNTLYLEVYDKLKDEEIKLNEKNKFATNSYVEIEFNLQNNNSNYGFTLYVNDVEYYIPFSGNTIDTLNNFVSKYYIAFYNMGITLSTLSNLLVLEGQYPNINIYSVDAKVNSYSSFEIIENIIGNGIFITGNELELPSGLSYNFYNYGVATGMIINITGSSYTLNNKQYNIVGLSESIIELSYQGAFFGGDETLRLTTEKYLRKPRESYDKDIYYSFRFENIENEIDNTSDIFFYDFTGEHLKPYANDTRLTYIGPKPLWDTENPCSPDTILLNDKQNKNLAYVNDRTKQQTVFRGQNGEYTLEFLLDQFDAADEYDFKPEPLQAFLGFNSTNEGVSKTIMVMDKVENIVYSGYTDSNDYDTNIQFEFTSNGELNIITTDINFNFNNYGFEKNQLIDIDFIDTAAYNTKIFPNYGPFRISHVSNKTIQIDMSTLDYELKYFNTSSNTYSYNYIIKTLPRTLLKVQVYGSTEIEEDRYNISLNNLGLKVDYEDEHIFSQSDIQEQGYDYILLNAKRKEMLSMFPEIYNYVGSYKSIINSINFFGWNDLEFNEYYRNVNPTSPLYQKLHRVRIPDMFDNTVAGWTTNDWITGKYDNKNWKKINLFNLSYNITDEQGNDILLYSLDEIQIKLNLLKKWLKRNMIPLSANLVDITGIAETENTYYRQHDVSNQSTKIYSSSNTEVVNFNYTSTLNFDTNYLFQINFYTLSGINPSGWTAKIQTFSRDLDTNNLVPQKYYKIMKNDLEPFSFNADKIVDQYLYIETQYYNDYGLCQTYNKMINTSTFKNYLLVNNNFEIPKNYNTKYINTGQNMNNIYYFDENGYIYLED
jgi:hypothetical protein